MEFRKHISIANKNIEFIFTHEPYITEDNLIVMGFPYYNFDKTNPEQNPDKVKGYYAAFKYSETELVIVNDILGNYRTYYLDFNNTIYFSNDFMTLFNILPKEQRVKNNFEFEFWEKHRYTTGGSSLCKKIKKLKPAHVYEFNQKGLKAKCYFKDIKNVPNRKLHFQETLDDLRETVSIIKHLPQKKFLLFSGGADSTLCVKLLQEQNVEFKPVFAKHIPTNSMNYEDTLKVLSSAKLLGISPIEIEIDTNKDIDSSIINTMFHDRSITQLFFETAKIIKEKYGSNVILINGQAADSIFGFGPTNDGVKFNMVRAILYQPFSVINKLYFELFKIFRCKFKNFRLPQNDDEYISAFFDEKSYIPILDRTKNQTYYDCINKITTEYKNHFKFLSSLLMYLKIYGFIQGSDNYVNVQNCEFYGIKSLFLYATPNIVYSTIKNTDYKYEIQHPKSVIYKILNNIFNYNMPKINTKKFNQNSKTQNKTFSQYEQEIYKKYFKRVSSLEFMDKKGDL